MILNALIADSYKDEGQKKGYENGEREREI